MLTQPTTDMKITDGYSAEVENVLYGDYTYNGGSGLFRRRIVNPGQLD